MRMLYDFCMTWQLPSMRMTVLCVFFMVAERDGIPSGLYVYACIWLTCGDWGVTHPSTVWLYTTTLPTCYACHYLRQAGVDSLGVKIGIAGGVGRLDGIEQVAYNIYFLCCEGGMEERLLISIIIIS